MTSKDRKNKESEIKTHSAAQSSTNNKAAQRKNRQALALKENLLRRKSKNSEKNES